MVVFYLSKLIFKVSFHLTVLLYVDKIFQNTLTELL